jgi:hypothetical protein
VPSSKNLEMQIKKRDGEIHRGTGYLVFRCFGQRRCWEARCLHRDVGESASVRVRSSHAQCYMSGSSSCTYSPTLAGRGKVVKYWSVQHGEMHIATGIYAQCVHIRRRVYIYTWSSHGKQELT